MAGTIKGQLWDFKSPECHRPSWVIRLDGYSDVRDVSDLKWVMICGCW